MFLRLQPQANTVNQSGFTLVEIMVVILIILLLLTIGNFGGLFQAKERSQLESIAVNIVAPIESSKIAALLGKTADGQIIRKRKVELALDNTAHTLTIESNYNLAADYEDLYPTGTKVSKTIELNKAEGAWYDCSTNTAVLINSTDATLTFTPESIRMTAGTSTENYKRLLLLLSQNTVSYEIIIDRRTGLVFDRVGKGKDTNGDWIISCN